MKTLATVALALMMPLTVSAAKAKKKQVVKKVSAIEIVQKMNDEYQKAHSPEVGTGADEAAYFAANMEAYRLTGNARYLEYCDKWARHNKWSGVMEAYLDLNELNPGTHKIASLLRADNIQSLPVLAKLYKVTRCPKYLDRILASYAQADVLSLVRTLDALPADAPQRQNIVDKVKSDVAAAPSLYPLLWTVNRGLLDKSKYDATIQQLWSDRDNSPISLLAACEKVRYDDSTLVAPRQMTVEVKNPSGIQRQEVVELSAADIFKRLGISGGRQFVVKNAIGNEIPSQLTHDGKILVDVAVAPSSAATITIVTGQPQSYVNTCYGRMYPERVDDIAWENDRGAYRCYGPALQRSGEDAYGNDVWVKNTPDLVVENRYHDELVNKLSYHVDRGYGLDCYKVGPTLGCGTPAIVNGDDIRFPYCWTSYELLDNGPLRFTVRLDYGVNGEHRILSLDKGSNFNKMTVWYDGITAPVDVASGVVIHTEDTESVVLGKDFVQYADPTDNPKNQNFQIYVATIFPDGVDVTRKVMYKNPVRGNAGHALGVKKGLQPNEKFTYYFGSSWSKYDCRNQKEWQMRIDTFKSALAQPLEIIL